jgi:hypothetical protein
VGLALLIGIYWGLGGGTSESLRLIKKLWKMVVFLSVGIIILQFHSFSLLFTAPNQLNTLKTIGIVLVGIAIFWGTPKYLQGALKKRGGHSLFEFPEWTWIPISGMAIGAWGGLVMVHSAPLSDHSHWLSGEVLPCLSFETSIAASEPIASHLISRDWVNTLPEIKMSDSRVPASEKEVDCVLVDSSLPNGLMSGEEVKQWSKGLLDFGYHEVWGCRDFRVFEHGVAGCLKCVPRCR